MLKRNEYPFVNDQGKEALNFQLSMTLYLFAAGLLVILTLGLVTVFLVPLAIVWVLAKVILVIIASINASNGKYHRYPITIRFIS